MFLKKKESKESPRRNKRMQADYLILYDDGKSDRKEPLLANVKDISATGVRFLTEIFFTEGTDMEVAFAIPPIGRTIHTKARVIRVRPSENSDLFYMSLKFIHMDPKDESDLNAFIEKLALIPGAKFMVDQPKNLSKRKVSY